MLPSAPSTPDLTCLCHSILHDTRPNRICDYTSSCSHHESLASTCLFHFPGRSLPIMCETLCQGAWSMLREGTTGLLPLFGAAPDRWYLSGAHELRSFDETLGKLQAREFHIASWPCATVDSTGCCQLARPAVGAFSTLTPRSGA